MAVVRVGTRRVIPYTSSLSGVGEPGCEFGQRWVEINGKRITAHDDGLVDVKYGVREPGGVAEIVIRIMSESFSTADYRE